MNKINYPIWPKDDINLIPANETKGLEIGSLVIWWALISGEKIVGVVIEKNSYSAKVLWGNLQNRISEHSLFGSELFVLKT